MILFGEYAPDQSDLNTNVTHTAHNVVSKGNTYAPCYEISTVSTALTLPCQGATTQRDNDGNNYIYAGDATKLYGIVSGTPTDYSQVGDYTSNAEKWGFINWGDNVIASKFGDTPQIMSLGSTTFADLGGSPPQGRTITTIRDFVVLGNTWDSTDGNITNRVRWSGFNDETEWTIGTNQSDSQDLEGRGGAIQRVTGGEVGIVFQERSKWLMSYVGTPTVFSFAEIEPGLGTPAGGSVVQHGVDIYYLGNDGFYVLKQNTSSLPIGAGKVDSWFFSNLNEAYIDNINAAIDPEQGLILWAYPSIDSTTGANDSIITYSFKTGKWTTRAEDTQVIFQGANSAYTLEGLDVFGDLDSLELSLDSPAWQGGAYKLGVFNSSNQYGFFAGAEKAGIITTGEIYDEKGYSRLSAVKPVIDGGSTIKIYYRNELIDTATETGDLVLSNGKANCRTNNRFHKIELTTTGTFSKAVGVEPTIKKGGFR